jgi:multisubunit Na+/H+ antiporter MnhB subunit
LNVIHSGTPMNATRKGIVSRMLARTNAVMSGASLFLAGGSSADLDMTQIISGASAVLLRNF